MSDTITELWVAYRRARDNGHEDFVEKAERCEKYFRGEQWSRADLARLGDRPALSVNMVLATMATAFGQMLENYTETMFFSKDPRQEEMNEVLRKVFKHVYNENKLRWADMDMAMDGFITSRGFLDVRMSFDDNLKGEVSINLLDPRDVLIDPDARDYLPTGWKEVFITRWLTLTEIEALYGKRARKSVEDSGMAPGSGNWDMVTYTDLSGTFSGQVGPTITAPAAIYKDKIPLRYRVVERQYKTMDVHEFFVDRDTGDTNPIPPTWNDDKIYSVMEQALAKGANLTIVRRPAERIKVSVFAARSVLHEAWSPYKNFTIVPYFPYFRWGNTMGVVENILDLQDATNKTLSQTLHVINTTANSGWVVKTGSLVNMTVQELEERGAETGLVVEVSQDIPNAIEKISPNSVPSGLDKITNQLSEWVKYVSGISDSMRGFDRADVAAKAIDAKQRAGAVSLAIPFENLNRTRNHLAKVVLDLVQQFYTEPRLLRVAPDEVDGESQTVEVNQPSATGAVLNDLTLGEYEVSIKSVPPAERMKESAFQQAQVLKQMGVDIPDWVLIETSGLPNPGKVMKAIDEQKQAAQQAAQAEQAKAAAEVALTQANAAAKQAEAGLLQARLEEVKSQIYGTNAKLQSQNEQIKLKALLEQDKLRREDAYRYRKLTLDTLINGTKNDANAGTNPNGNSGTNPNGNSGTKQ